MQMEKDSRRDDRIKSARDMASARLHSSLINARALISVINSKPKMRKMLIVTCLAFVLILIWASQVISSHFAYQNYFNSMDAWLTWYNNLRLTRAPEHGLSDYL
jgi:hypothetical protein